MSKFTLGNWSEGKQIGTIISDVDSSDAYSQETRDFYGGMLIAESIANPNDVRLIKYAPEMHKKLKLILGMYAKGIQPSIGFIEEIEQLINRQT